MLLKRFTLTAVQIPKICLRRLSKNLYNTPAAAAAAIVVFLLFRQLLSTQTEYSEIEKFNKLTNSHKMYSNLMNNKTYIYILKKLYMIVT